MKKTEINICDFHTHLLPTADHGSSSIETSVCQLKLAEECGVSRIVATPHFYPHKDSVSSFLAKRDASYASLLPHIPESIELRIGAEVLFCGNLENIPDVEKLCIFDSNVMLLELPFAAFDINELSSVGALIDKGIEIIIAHAERYSTVLIDECLDYGATLQINATSLAVDKRIPGWLECGYISALGSDIHGRDKNAYKCFKKAPKRIKSYINEIKNRSDSLWEKFSPYKSQSATVI